MGHSLLAFCAETRVAGVRPTMEPLEQVQVWLIILHIVQHAAVACPLACLLYPTTAFAAHIRTSARWRHRCVVRLAITHAGRLRPPQTVASPLPHAPAGLVAEWPPLLLLQPRARAIRRGLARLSGHRRGTWEAASGHVGAVRLMVGVHLRLFAAPVCFQKHICASPNGNSEACSEQNERRGL